MKDTKPILEVTDLATFFYGTNGTVIKAVDGVTFNINENDVVGLVGESGSGKSTIAFSILRLIFPPGRIVRGRIRYKEVDILQLAEDKLKGIRGKEISMVFQDPTTYLNPVMKIKDQICEAIISHEGCTNELATEKCADILEQVTLSPEVMSQYPFELSCGMQQRVVLAIALSCSPSLLIMDEPTTALDATIQAQILKLIKSIRDSFHVGILLITHDLGIVAEICDKTNVVYMGKIVEQGDVIELYESPMHPYTRGLLESVLSIDEFKAQLVAIRGSTPDPASLPHGCAFHPRCPEAMAICKKEMPPVIKARNNHIVQCWKFAEVP